MPKLYSYFCYIKTLLNGPLSNVVKTVQCIASSLALAILFGFLVASSNAMAWTLSAIPAESSSGDLGEKSQNLISSVQVYSKNSKIPLDAKPFSNNYDVQSGDAEWQYVTFGKPTVRAWVSSRFVAPDAGSSSRVLTTDRVNIRIEPSIDSRILGIVRRGGVLVPTGVLSNEYIQVYAPQSFVFALRVDNSDNTQNTAGITPDSRTKTDLPVQAIQKVDSQPSNQADIANIQISNQSQNSTPSTPFELPQSNRAVLSNEATVSRVVAPTSLPIQTGNSQVIAEVTPPTTDKADAGLGERLDKTSDRLVYKIAAGDSISLQVFGEPDLSAESLRVPLTGQVGFPLIGTINVAGMRIQQVEREVIRRLQSGYINNPKVSVTIAEYRPVFVKGAVRKVGQFQYTEGLTVAKLLLLAELKPSAKPDSVAITRDSILVAQNLSTDSNIQISPGDVISVDQGAGFSEQDDTAFVYLHGEVKKPGAYEFVRGLTVEKAIVLAGGFSLRASKKRISITREVPNQIEPTKLKKVKLYEPIQPGDIIDVGASWF
jgi:polysaccharide export outer membrane protein